MRWKKWASTCRPATADNLVPHYPLVFNADGSIKTDPGYFSNADAPIIIIQGDHGVYGIDRESNFEAYYLPNNGAAKFYNTISPVNSFWVIFNTYFQGQYKLLPDIAFEGDAHNPAKFVMNSVTPACGKQPQP